MRPYSSVVHIASSSLARVWEANMAGLMLLRLGRETSHTVRVMWPNTQRGLANSLPTNQSTVRRHKTSANNMHSHKIAHTHNGQLLNYSTWAHAPIHSQSHIFWQILILPRKRMHQSLALFSLSNKNTLSYTHRRYVYSTRQTCRAARLHPTTLILLGNCDYSDGSLYVWPQGYWGDVIYRPTVTLKNVLQPWLPLWHQQANSLSSDLGFYALDLHERRERTTWPGQSRQREMSPSPFPFVAIIFASCFFCHKAMAANDVRVVAGAVWTLASGGLWRALPL